MRYIKLGNTGLDVSPIALGGMTYGEPDRGHPVWSLPKEDSRPLIKQAVGFKEGRDDIKVSNVRLPSPLKLPEEPDEEAIQARRAGVREADEPQRPRSLAASRPTCSKIRIRCSGVIGFCSPEASRRSRWQLMTIRSGATHSAHGCARKSAPVAIFSAAWYAEAPFAKCGRAAASSHRQ